MNVKIIIGPVILLLILLFIAAGAFVVFRKKYVSPRSFLRTLAYSLNTDALSLLRQTEGPTGPLIASSNPEYISANDGKPALTGLHVQALEPCASVCLVLLLIL